MQQISCPLAAQRRDHCDPVADNQIHKLKDGPPYGSIHLTTHGIEALRSESEKFRTVDSWRAMEESEFTSYGNRINGDKDVRADYDNEYSTRENTYKVHQEDINSEAEEFIEVEHQKLNLRKWMSMN